MEEKFSERLKRLPALIVNHYPKRYGWRRLIKIIEALLGKVKNRVEVDKDMWKYLAIYIASTITSDLVHVVKAALRDRLTYREFSLVFDKGIWGPVDVARTIAVYPSGLYASLTYVPTSKVPEYYLLGEMIDRVLDNVKRIIDDWSDHQGQDADGLEQAIRDLRKNYEELMELRAGLPKPSVEYACEELMEAAERILPYSPWWFRYAYEAYKLVTHLSNNYVASGKGRLSEEELILLGWRLYEILTYIVVLSILEEDGYVIREKKSRRLVVAKGNSEVELLFNKPMEGSIIASVNDDAEKAKRIRGRPDAVIRGRGTIVVECKFSEDPTYITAGRIKVMAYMYEYGADLGILVFPGFNAKGIYDEEDRATMSIWESMERNDGVAKIALSNGKAIYMIKADPAEGKKAEEAWNTIEARLRRALAESGLISGGYEVGS